MDFSTITCEQKLRVLMEEVPRMNMKWSEEKLETIRQRERAESLEKMLEHERVMRKEAESMAKEYEAMVQKMIRGNCSVISSVVEQTRLLKIVKRCQALGIPFENKSLHALEYEISKTMYDSDSDFTSEKIRSMDRPSLEQHCRECGIDIEDKGLSEMRRELRMVKISAPSPVEVSAVEVPAASPVQDAPAPLLPETEPIPAPSPVEVPAPPLPEAEPMPAPVGSVIDVDEELDEELDEEPLDVTKARIVMNAYNKLVEDVLISPVRDAKLLCAHAENLGIEVHHQKREQLVEEMRVALAAGAQLSNPVKMLQMYEKRLVELADFAIKKGKKPIINVNASTLRAHCKHYELGGHFLICMDKDQLYDLLLKKLRA